jgi:hypothetical protein
MAGAAGFEPTITGSKPDALPLGYAPIGDPCRIRTYDLQLRRLLLYPAELRDLVKVW